MDRDAVVVDHFAFGEGDDLRDELSGFKSSPPSSLCGIAARRAIRPLCPDTPDPAYNCGDDRQSKTRSRCGCGFGSRCNGGLRSISFGHKFKRYAVPGTTIASRIQTWTTSFQAERGISKYPTRRTILLCREAMHDLPGDVPTRLCPGPSFVILSSAR